MRKVRLTERTGSGLAQELAEAGEAALSPDAHTFNHKHQTERAKYTHVRKAINS